jgi:hypothetical protein
LRCGGDVWGCEHAEAWKYCMHKEQRDYKNVEQRRDWGSCHCGGELKCVQGGRRREQKCTVEEWCIEGIWRIENKRPKKKSDGGVQKTLMQTGQSSVTEQ